MEKTTSASDALGCLVSFALIWKRGEDHLCRSLARRSESEEKIKHSYRGMPPGAVPRIPAPVVVTLAKTSHMRRKGASRWTRLHCNTIRFSSTGLARNTREVGCSPVASQENLSSCIQKFACCRKHPACPCSVFHCTCTMWISSRQRQPRRQYRPRTPHEGQWLRTSLLSVCCKHAFKL